jgi:RNA polymerase sigma factor (sigma-70 family)
VSSSTLARLSTWLHRIVVNEALMWLRSEGRRRRRLGSLTADPSLGPAVEIHPQSRWARCEQVEELRRYVARLPEPERGVIEACALGERSYADYAAANSIAAEAAKSRAFRARRRLRDWLTCC